MSDLDLGPVQRCLDGSEMTRALLLTLFNPRAPCVDYGAGYGLFVRRMRDLGFDFRYFDKYPSNLFAKGFETAELSGYELLTAFEVFEHLVSPVEDVRSMARFAPNLFFSTLLLPAHQPLPGDWWYYGLDHGQHVSLHTHRSLSILGERCGLRLVSDRNLFHLFTPESVPEFVFRQLISPRWRGVIGSRLSRLRKIHSRLPEDFNKAFGSRALE